ncbi:MAG: hypothetical protein EPN43_02870, partial [Jatrophihabitans sp.]
MARRRGPVRPGTPQEDAGRRRRRSGRVVPRRPEGLRPRRHLHPQAALAQPGRDAQRLRRLPGSPVGVRPGDRVRGDPGPLPAVLRGACRGDHGLRRGTAPGDGTRGHAGIRWCRVSAFAIVGGGQTAAVAARTLRRRGFDGRIEIIGAEAHPPYQRPPLTKEYLAGGPGDDLFLLDEQWCAANDVTLRLGVRAVRIRPADFAVDLADGTQVHADKVLIATGGAARKLPGVRGDRVHYLRTLEDANRLRDLIGPGTRLVVIGAGFIGSEVAATAHGKGAEVTVVDTLDAPLQRILGRELGAVCADIHRSNGVRVRLGEPVESVVEHADAVIVRTSGARLEGDHVVIGVGITPNVEVAQRSGVTVDNGVLVDEYCRTSVPNIFAAGDIANHYHPLFDELIRVEHFDNANKQAAAAANNMLGNPTVFDDPHWFWSDQYDL